jgi:predicted MPP superfamily phosphohydrolase
MSQIPGNQLLSVSVHEKRLRLPRLPSPLTGLKIAHLSDVHMTGRIDVPFYERIVDLTNELDADIVMVSGDLIENTRCWDWVPGTFGRLRSQHGTYFVLGNHDVRIDYLETRRRLKDAGLINLGERSTTITLRGVEVLLAGNERPWIDDIVDPPATESTGAAAFRILLSHSPDQYAWARRHRFDLMLAGHVHGGQIRLPPIGPILAPSGYGVRYACGVFHEPPTVMHVSRGTSSKAPFRFFCPPELTLLILESPG